jgi:hypothetical protein
MVVEAVPMRADDRVADKWSHHGHLRFRQDALCLAPVIENHSIDLGGEVGDLLIELVVGVDLDGEISDGIKLGDKVHD